MTEMINSLLILIFAVIFGISLLIKELVKNPTKFTKIFQAVLCFALAVLFYVSFHLGGSWIDLAFMIFWFVIAITGLTRA